jgi:dynein heavy chain 1
MVNFDPQVIALFKEVRNLTWLNYQVPHSITNISKEAKRVYPYAVSLMETVRTLAQTNRTISEMSEVSVLLSGYQNDVHNLITKGVPLKWESFVHSYDLHLRQLQFLPNGGIDASTSLAGRESRHVQFVRDFGAAVSILQAKTGTLAGIHDTIQKAMAELRTCPYHAEAFQHTIDTIQTAVDQLNLENYVNLAHWVGELNQKIEAIFLNRLQEAVMLWIEVFKGEKDDGVDSDIVRKRMSRIGEPGLDTSAREDGYSPKMRKLVHEISIRNQVIYLDPPLEFARASWFSQFHEWLGVVCNLHKLKASRYEMRINIDAEVEVFSELVCLLRIALSEFFMLTSEACTLCRRYFGSLHGRGNEDRSGFWIC